MFIPGKPLHNETQRHVARLNTRSNDHISHLDLLIRGLVDGGLWSLLDILCVAGPDAADSLLDLKGLRDSSLVGAPAFVADQGFTTVSTTAIINTGYTFSVGTRDNNSSLSVYIQNASAGAGYFAGETYGASSPTFSKVALQDSSSTVFSAAMQSAAADSRASAGGGFRQASRVDASTVLLNSDGATTTLTRGSVSWEAAYHFPLLIGCLNNAGTPSIASANEYSHWSVGQGLDAAQSQAFRLLIHEYFTNRGTAV